MFSSAVIGIGGYHIPAENQEFLLMLKNGHWNMWNSIDHQKWHIHRILIPVSGSAQSTYNYSKYLTEFIFAF